MPSTLDFGASDETAFPINPIFRKSADYVQSPFRYPGGKFYALKFIVPFLNAFPHIEYREPFLGGGSVYFGKPKAAYNWLNDLESRMIETYRAIQDPARSLLLQTRVANEVATRSRHEEIKALKVSDEDDIAFQTFYLNRTSYSGIINVPAWGYEVGYSSPPENWPRAIGRVQNKLRDVRLTSLDFEEVLGAPTESPETLSYLDPPYFLADQKRAYTRSFTLDDHLRLERLLRNLDYGFVLSYDDCDEIRDLYSWANIYPRTWFHNTANSSGPRKVGKELILTNFNVRVI